MLQKVPGAVSVNSTGTQLAPEISIQFDRNKAQALGVNLQDAANAAGAAFGGNVATQFETTAGLEQVQVIYPTSSQTSLEALKSVAIRSSSGGIVYLSDIARFESTPTSPLITRTDRNNVIHVNANYAPNSSLSAVEAGPDQASAVAPSAAEYRSAAGPARPARLHAPDARRHGRSR